MPNQGEAPPSDQADLRPFVERWGLAIDGPPIRTATSWVQFVLRGEEALALKLVTHPDEANQRLALAHFAGHGAVRLIEWDGAAMLMERARPGASLASLTLQGRDEEAAAIACEVIRQLHEAPAPDGGFVTVELWGAAFERTGPSALQRGVDPEQLDRAGRLYAALCASQGPRRLLHGDLQHYNILLDEKRGWLAIDPKGVIGETAFEVGAFMRNPEGGLCADTAVVTRRATTFAERLNLDLRRVLGWTFCQAVLSALWSIEDGGEPDDALALARATSPLL